MPRVAALFVLIVIGGLTVTLISARVPVYFFSETMLGQIGINVGVLPNQYNTLNQALDQKQAYLNEREAYLNSREGAIGSSTPVAQASVAESDPLVWSFIVGMALLTVLVMLNFYFDWKRGRRANIPQGGAETPSAA